MIFFRISVLLFVSFMISACASTSPPKSIVAEQLINTSTDAIARFRAHPDLKKFSHELESATAVVILPTVIKAGFFAGGETGNGVLLKHNKDNSWSYPTYVTLAAASFGLQFGIQDTAIILVIRNSGALESILDHQGKIGADTGVAIGAQGLGLEASTTSNLNTDIIAFASPNIGGYMGVSAEGAVLATRHDLNEAFYGEGAKPKTILAGQHSNPIADTLRSSLAEK